MSTFDGQYSQVWSSRMMPGDSGSFLKSNLGQSKLGPWLGGVKSYHSRTASRDVYDYFFKILLVGPAMSGKSSIVRQYCEKHFIEDYQATFGMQNHLKTLLFGDKIVRVSIWDSPSDQKFSHQTHNHASNADAVVFVYDSTNEESLIQTQTLIEEFKADFSAKVTLFALSNKKDLRKKGAGLVTLDSETIQNNHITTFTASARSCRLIGEIFNQIIERLMEKQNKLLQRQQTYEDSEIDQNNQSIEFSNDNLKKLIEGDDREDIETQLPRKRTDISYASNFGVSNNSTQLNLKPLGDTGEILTTLFSPSDKIRRIKLKSPRVVMENEHNIEQRPTDTKNKVAAQKQALISKKAPTCDPGCQIF